MKNKKRSSLFVLILFLVFIPWTGYSACADSMRFVVSPEIPENQKDRNKTYFDLKMKPDQKQTLKVKLTNLTDESLEIEMHTTTAITNDNGVVDYSQTDLKDFDDSLMFPFSKIATPRQTSITLPAKETDIVLIDLHMPKQSYDGLILGGLHFSEKEKSKGNSDSSSVQIQNLFAYVIGVSLRETETEVLPNLTLNEIQPSQVNYRNVIKANLQNNQAAVIKKLTVEAKIFMENGTEVLYKGKKEDMRMAPNSNFNYGISLNNKAFKAGTYRLEIDAKADGETYRWIDYFTINAKDAKKLNDQAVDLEKELINWQVYLIIGLIIIAIFLLLVVLFIINRNHKKEVQKRQSAQKKKKHKISTFKK